MIVDVGKIIDKKFLITAEVKEGIKTYLIGKDIFLARLNNEEWELDSNSISGCRYDGLIVASLVDELKELENTYAITYILNMYFRGYTVSETRKAIINEMNKVNANS